MHLLDLHLQETCQGHRRALYKVLIYWRGREVFPPVLSGRSPSYIFHLYCTFERKKQIVNINQAVRLHPPYCGRKLQNAYVGGFLSYAGGIPSYASGFLSSTEEKYDSRRETRQYLAAP